MPWPRAFVRAFWFPVSTEARPEPTLSVAACTRLRSVLVTLQTLLEKLEAGLGSYAGASDNIKRYVERIDIALQAAPTEVAPNAFEINVTPWEPGQWEELNFWCV
jgi:hypothetical protein